MTYNETEGKYWEISVRSQDRRDNISVKTKSYSFGAYSFGAYSFGSYS